LQHLNKDGNMHSLYALKVALMKMDMPNEDIQKEGFAELEEIACLKGEHKKQKAGKFPALYYIGLYHWENDNFDKAKKVWDKLIAKAATPPSEDETSPYVMLAKEKLKQINE